MQCTNLRLNMSFGFDNINPQIKAQAAYKDASGMGGGGMYFKQGKKRKDEPDEDMFERSEDKNDDEILFGSDNVNNKIAEDVPSDNIVNKFVNWFRIKKD